MCDFICVHLFLKAFAVRNYLVNKLEAARRALMSAVKEQDHVISRFKSYRVFREQCTVEDELFSGDVPLRKVRVSIPVRHCDLIADLRRNLDSAGAVDEVSD